MEKVLDKAQTDATGHGNSWQLTDSGTLQVGPKDRLNKFKYVKLYPIAGLLLEIPDYNNAPEFDLQSVLQSQTGKRRRRRRPEPLQEKQQKTRARSPSPIASRKSRTS